MVASLLSRYLRPHCAPDPTPPRERYTFTRAGEGRVCRLATVPAREHAPEVLGASEEDELVCVDGATLDDEAYV